MIDNENIYRQEIHKSLILLENNNLSLKEKDFLLTYNKTLNNYPILYIKNLFFEIILNVLNKPEYHKIYFNYIDILFELKYKEEILKNKKIKTEINKIFNFCFYNKFYKNNFLFSKVDFTKYQKYLPLIIKDYKNNFINKKQLKNIFLCIEDNEDLFNYLVKENNLELFELFFNTIDFDFFDKIKKNNEKIDSSIFPNINKYYFNKIENYFFNPNTKIESLESGFFYEKNIKPLILNYNFLDIFELNLNNVAEEDKNILNKIILIEKDKKQNEIQILLFLKFLIQKSVSFTIKNKNLYQQFLLNIVTNKSKSFKNYFGRQLLNKNFNNYINIDSELSLQTIFNYIQNNDYKEIYFNENYKLPLKHKDNEEIKSLLFNILINNNYNYINNDINYLFELSTNNLENIDKLSRYAFFNGKDKQINKEVKNILFKNKTNKEFLLTYLEEIKKKQKNNRKLKY